MSYSQLLSFIDDIDTKIKQKENELLMLKFMNSNSIIHNMEMRNLESEIEELRMQRTYHTNYIADQLMRICSECSGNCLRRKNVFYYIIIDAVTPIIIRFQKIQ